MSTSTCASCHSLLRLRLRMRITDLQHLRRSQSTTTKPRSLSWYKDTTAPTPAQLQAAEKFFLSHTPRKLWTATEWRTHSDAANKSVGLIPEVAFLGRSNVGKSSLLNALLLSPGLNYVGPRPGKTKTMHAWALSPTDPKTGGALRGMKGDIETKCAVLDMPGYGHASHDTWGEEILTYLRNRKQLKRAFVVVDLLHGLKSGDLTMLKLLRKQGISTQVVASKCDKMKETEGQLMVQGLWDQIESEGSGHPGLRPLGEVLVVGNVGDGRKNDSVHYKNMRGVAEVQWAILRAAGLEKYAEYQVFPETRASAPEPRPQTRLPPKDQYYLHNPLTDASSIRGAPQRWEFIEPPPNLPGYSYDPSTETYSLAEVRKLSSKSRPLPKTLSEPYYNPLTEPRAITATPESGPPVTPSSDNQFYSYDTLTDTYSLSSRPAHGPHIPLPSISGYYSWNPLTETYSALRVIKWEPWTGPDPWDRKGRPSKVAATQRPKLSLAAIGRGIQELMAVVAPHSDEDSPENLEEKEEESASASPSAPLHTKEDFSVVGAKGDLEALMARTLGPAGRKRKRKGMQESAPEQTKEEWSGSAVGGMADLEAMMARTLGRGDGEKKRKKKRH